MYCVLLNVLTILIRSDGQQYLTDAWERDLKTAWSGYVSLYHIQWNLRITTTHGTKKYGRNFGLVVILKCNNTNVNE